MYHFRYLKYIKLALNHMGERYELESRMNMGIFTIMSFIFATALTPIMCWRVLFTDRAKYINEQVQGIFEQYYLIDED